MSLAGWPSRPWKRRASRIAKLIGATAKEIIFTSGATESDNLAIKGVAEMYHEKGNHIITQTTEHKAVLDTCKRLEKHGFRVTYLPVRKTAASRSRRTEARAWMTRQFSSASWRRTTRLASCSRSRNRRALPRARRAVSHRCRAGDRQGSVRRRSTTNVDLRRISGPQDSTARRASGRFTSVARIRACSWWRRSMAAATSAACVRAR